MLIQRIALGALVLATCTASAAVQDGGVSRADRELAEALKDRVAGEPVDCISLSGVDGPQIIDKDTLLYRETGRTVWRNELPATCPGLSNGDTLIVEVHGSQLCRNDHFRALTPGASIPSGVCRFGKFTPYRK